MRWRGALFIMGLALLAALGALAGAFGDLETTRVLALIILALLLWTAGMMLGFA